jgi:hypothetical protein
MYAERYSHQVSEQGRGQRNADGVARTEKYARQGVSAEVVGAQVEVTVFALAGRQEAVIAVHVHFMKGCNTRSDNTDHQPEYNDTDRDPSNP